MDDPWRESPAMQGRLVGTCPPWAESSPQSNARVVGRHMVIIIGEHTCWLINRMAMSFRVVNSSNAASMTGIWVSENSKLVLSCASE